MNYLNTVEINREILVALNDTKCRESNSLEYLAGKSTAENLISCNKTLDVPLLRQAEQRFRNAFKPVNLWKFPLHISEIKLESTVLKIY